MRTQTKSKLCVVLGNKEKTFDIDYPKFSNNAKLIEQVFFENFSGAVSSVILYSEYISPTNILKLNTELPLGIIKENDLILLSGISPTNTYCVLSPYKTKNRIIKNLYYSELTFLLNGNSGLCERRRYIDSINNVLPLFQIISLMEIKDGQRILCDLLKFSRTYFMTLREGIQLNKESKAFVRMLALQLLEFDPVICNEELIECLGDLMSVCSLLRKRILKIIMTTINFWVNIEVPLLSLFWMTIKGNLSCDVKEYIKIVNTQKILQFVGTLDKSIKEHSCCKKHGAFVKSTSEDRYKSMKSLLKFVVISDPKNQAENLSRILCIMSQKPSPCLFLFLLEVMKDLIDTSTSYIKTLFNIGGIFEIFTLARDYPVDIKIECLTFASIVIKQIPALDWWNFRNELLKMLETSPEFIKKIVIKLIIKPKEIRFAL